MQLFTNFETQNIANGPIPDQTFSVATPFVFRTGGISILQGKFA